MKTLFISLTLTAILFGTGKTSYQAEMTTALSFEAAFNKTAVYISNLPKVNKLLQNEVVENKAEKFIESKRSFIAYKYNQLYKQPKAEVHYTVKVTLNEGKYSYEFSDFHIYTYKRNRYGVFNRSSSKAFSLEKLSNAKQKELKPLIATEINKYIAGLKNTLTL